MKQYLLVLSFFFISFEVNAFSWTDLWSTPDQQGQSLMEKNQFKKAKDIFERNDWAAAAAYKAGDYERAADLFSGLKTEQGYYNQGNALAHLGKYEQAIEAYDKALATNPNDQDALYNRKLVSDLLKKDKEQKQNKDQQQNQDKQNQDKQNQDKQNQDKQNQDKQNQDKQDQDKQDQDKQEKNKSKNKQQNKQQDQDKKQEDDVQSEANQEQQQAKEQWLRLIPDDPGGLMREKFLRDHLRRERGWYQ